MLKKTITYVDYNGVERTEDFYFNLTKVECVELEYSLSPGTSLSDVITMLINAKDIGKIISTIKNVVLTAYGEKSPDGKRFIKSEEMRNEFSQTVAFDNIYWELVSDPEKAADFITGILPSDLRNNLGSNPKAEVMERMKAIQGQQN